jgi:hypothetical protein
VQSATREELVTAEKRALAYIDLDQVNDAILENLHNAVCASSTSDASIDRAITPRNDLLYGDSLDAKDILMITNFMIERRRALEARKAAKHLKSRVLKVKKSIIKKLSGPRILPRAPFNSPNIAYFVNSIVPLMTVKVTP